MLHQPRTTSGRRQKLTRTALGAATVGTAVLGAVLLNGSTSPLALAGSGYHHDEMGVGRAAQTHRQVPDIRMVVTNPRPGDIAGRNGDFTVLVAATAQNADGNRLLNARHGYRPGLNLPPADTFGPGLPDPNAPGLVVTLSSTPAAAGGPNANLAGVFQLNTVTAHHGFNRVINDWEVGSPGFFGEDTEVTLTAYLVAGTAPGMVTGHETPISNVVHETFTIG